MEIKEGDLVKVPIYDGPNIEIMWFEVMFVDNNGEFIGKCDTRVIAMTSISYQDHVRLNISDIVEVYDELADICYKSQEQCKHGCDGLCKNSC